MNKNIEVISEKVWAVDFNFVKMGYIKELTFKNQESTDCLAVLTNDGKYILNKAVSYSGYVPFIQAVMTLNTTELNSKQGFCKVIRTIAPSIKKMTDDQIIKFIWSDNSITGNWTIYQNLCKWESERRTVEKQYIKKYWFLVGVKKLLKRMGVNYNGKYTNAD